MVYFQLYIIDIRHLRSLLKDKNNTSIFFFLLGNLKPLQNY